MMEREEGWYFVKWEDEDDPWEPAYYSFDQWERLQVERMRVAVIGHKIEEPKE